MPVKTTIQIRRDSASNWSSQVLAAGEFGLDTTNMRLKIGDGSTGWSSLGFLKAGTATALETARTINGVSFDGSANITVPAAAGTLTGSTLASGVTASSLTSVGTITSGTWSGSFGTVSGANLTNLTAGNLSGTIPSAVLGNSSVYIGRTSIPLNRTSSDMPLSGISYVTFYGSTSGTLKLQPNAVSGTNTITFPAATGVVALTSDITTANNGTLTLGVSGTGLSGSASFSANQSGNATFTVTSNATSSNTASTIVARDASGNFSSGTINGTTIPTNKTLVITDDINNSVQPYNSATTGITSGTGYLYNTAGTWSYVNKTFVETSAIGTSVQGYSATLAGITTLGSGTGYLKNTAGTWSYVDANFLTSADVSGTYLTISDASTNYQPKDSDLTAIAALSGTGYLKNTAGTWGLDNSSYLPSSTTYVTSINGSSGVISGIATNAAPTLSNVTISAGTNTAGGAPLYLNSGSVLDTPVGGAVEYDGKVIYISNTTSKRALVPAAHFYGLTSSRTLSNNSLSQSIFGVGLALAGSTTYEIEGIIQFNFSAVSGTVTATLNIGYGSVANGTLVQVDYGSNSTGYGTASSVSTISASGLGGNALVASTTGTLYVTAKIKGILRTSSGGTWTPSITFGGGALSTGPTIYQTSYIKATPIGSSSVAGVGAWA